MNGESQASPSQRVVGAGGAGEVQGEHEQGGVGRLLITARKKIRRPMTVQAQVVK